MLTYIITYFDCLLFVGIFLYIFKMIYHTTKSPSNHTPIFTRVMTLVTLWMETQQRV